MINEFFHVTIIKIIPSETNMKHFYRQANMAKANK